jgi:hypothetical protein
MSNFEFNHFHPIQKPSDLTSLFDSKIILEGCNQSYPTREIPQQEEALFYILAKLSSLSQYPKPTNQEAIFINSTDKITEDQLLKISDHAPMTLEHGHQPPTAEDIASQFSYAWSRLTNQNDMWTILTHSNVNIVLTDDHNWMQEQHTQRSPNRANFYSIRQTNKDPEQKDLKQIDVFFLIRPEFVDNHTDGFERLSLFSSIALFRSSLRNELGKKRGNLAPYRKSLKVMLGRKVTTDELKLVANGSFRLTGSSLRLRKPWEIPELKDTAAGQAAHFIHEAIANNTKYVGRKIHVILGNDFSPLSLALSGQSHLVQAANIVEKTSPKLAQAIYKLKEHRWSVMIAAAHQIINRFQDDHALAHYKADIANELLPLEIIANPNQTLLADQVRVIDFSLLPDYLVDTYQPEIREIIRTFRDSKELIVTIPYPLGTMSEALSVQLSEEFNDDLASINFFGKAGVYRPGKVCKVRRGNVVQITHTTTAWSELEENELTTMPNSLLALDIPTRVKKAIALTTNSLRLQTFDDIFDILENYMPPKLAIEFHTIKRDLNKAQQFLAQHSSKLKLPTIALDMETKYFSHGVNKINSTRKSKGLEPILSNQLYYVSDESSLDDRRVKSRKTKFRRRTIDVGLGHAGVIPTYQTTYAILHAIARQIAERKNFNNPKL